MMMRLQQVTITGADDSTDPLALVDLSRDFPFVEWAILVSDKRENRGGGRWPSDSWMRRFAPLAQEHGLACSLHLCGSFVRFLLQGLPTFLSDGPVSWMFEACQRVQINTHGEPAEWNAYAIMETLTTWGDRDVIQQIDGGHGQEIIEAVLGYFPNVVPLYDLSHGAGVLPGQWPKPQFFAGADESYMPHGYAGGLGPDNLGEQLPLIAAAAEGAPFWIDMETKVRTDGRFDLAKVRRCLEIAAPFVERSA